MAMSRKLTMAWMKLPYLMAASSMPAASSAARTTYFRVLKSMPPKRAPMTGMSRSFTRDWTMAVNALPMMMPTAISITLPRVMNSLNSETMPFFSIVLFSLPWNMVQYITLFPLWLYFFARIGGFCR